MTQTTGNTSYVYRADGTKLSKTYGTKVTNYLDGFQYENNVLQFTPTAEGYYDFVKNAYIYNYTDHLGNVRLSYTKDKSTGALTILEENNYYAFGLKHEGYNENVASSTYNYKYQGQELQETGFYSFKWRNYMPDVGRFFNIDPLSEKYAYQSPYNFAENKVIAFRELEGLEGIHHTLVDQKGTKSHVIEKNLIVLTQKTQDVPVLSSNPTKQEIRTRNRVIRQNNRTESANQARINYAKKDLENFYSGTHQNSAGEKVTFKINVSAMPVENSKAEGGLIDGTPLTTVAWRNGIESGNVNADGKNQRSPASIWTTKPTSSTGQAQVLGPLIYEINNQTPSIGNFSHEFGHNLGLDHPDGGGYDGLMHYPPEGLTTSEIDTIIKESYPAKK